MEHRTAEGASARHAPVGEIAYTVRESDKARRVILRIRPRSGLEVVLPRGYDRAAVPGIVRAKYDWVLRTLGRMAAHDSAALRSMAALPDRATLAAVGRSFVIQPSRAAAGPSRLVQNGPTVLSFTGDCCDTEACLALLRGWLLEQGRRHLGPWLRDLGRELGLGFDAVRIRAQRTRWGSCSSRGVVSLNCRLLFLPAELTRYVLVHELCHTVHLNHGPAFWKLVAAHEPAWRVLDKGLNQAWRHVPAWAS